MSGLEILAIAGCVAAVISAYHDGTELIQHIKAKRKAKRALQDGSAIDVSTQELEQSLKRGETVINSQYERDFRRFGESFALGDQVSRDALKDIIIHLQQQVISNLKIHWQQDAFVDFDALMDVSDSSQDRCILVLMQLQQRIITSGPIDIVTPPPLNPANAFGPPQTLGASARNQVRSVVWSCPRSPEFSNNTTFVANGFHSASGPHQYPAIEPQCQIYASHSPPKTQYISNRPLTPPVSPIPPPYSPHLYGPRGYIERVDTEPNPPSSLDGRSSSQSSYPSIGSSSKPRHKFFKFGTKAKVEKRDSSLENSVISDSTASATIEYPQRPSITASVSTAPSSTLEPDNPDFNPWHDCDSPSQVISPKPIQRTESRSESSSSSIGRGVAPAPMINMESLTTNKSINGADQKKLLPSEANKCAGFCKGAWRKQIGDEKKAIEDRMRPGGMYTAAKYWQCKHCKFQGRLVPIDRRRNGYDMRVFRLVEGIQFRWEFLFKSHMPSKDSSADLSKATFGCIFCCAEGRGASSLNGIQALAEHLVQHRDPLPTGEVLYRMNCIVGRHAKVEEDFDINIVSRSRSLF